MSGDGGAAAGPYAPYLTPRFRRRLDALRERDPGGHARVTEVMTRLLGHPEDADGQMHGPLRGMRKKYAGRGGWRILYNSCTACRKANLRRHAACPACATIPDRSVVFLDLYRKSERQPE